MRDHNDDLDRLDERTDARLEGTTRRDLAEGEQRLTLSEEQLAIGKREQQAGEVSIDKSVETRHVREAVPVTRDEVTVERRPVTDADGLRADGAFTEEHISVPLHKEEVVAEKHAVAAEELVVRKHQVQEEQMVEADLRRERAEVHEDGNVRRTDSTLDDGTRGGMR